MTKIAHIIHPGDVPQSSDLFVAQPITFETMRIAKEFAKGKVDVSLYAIKHHDESPHIPDSFLITNDLNRSVMDIKSFKTKENLHL